MNKLNRVLFIIVISQFFCTSLWFGGNGIIGDIIADFNLEESALGHLTSSVQFGFILGTLFFALFTVADRYSPSKVFFVCGVLASIINLAIIWEGNTMGTLVFIRTATGFFLAGIYPVGMKIASDYFEKGLGKSLGFLVGALVLGTALPHLVKGMTIDSSWYIVIVITSVLAFLGGLLMLVFVPNGPNRMKGKALDFSAAIRVFRSKKFRSAAFGYFGHMWELYAFWSFVPIMLSSYIIIHSNVQFNIPILSFFIIAIGSVSCVVGGYISEIIGTKKTAFIALLLSCICCLISPFMFAINMEYVFVLFLFFWGVVVIMDSPLFSTLVAQNADPKIKGTALTIVNCIGFSITIVSIQLISFMHQNTDNNSMYVLLAIGPIIGLLALKTN